MSRSAKNLSVLFLVGAILLPSISSAQTVADLQAQIQALLAQIQQLQAQLAARGGGETAPPAFCYDFKENLRVGDKSPAVTSLQVALEKERFSIANDIDGIFGEGTASAVSGFQEKYRSEVLAPVELQHGNGYVGRLTRAKLNSLFGCAVPPTISPIIPTPGTGTGSGGGGGVMIGVPMYSAFPTDNIVLGSRYTFSAKVTNAKPNSRILFYLQRPDGTMKYNEASNFGVGGVPAWTDANGNWSRAQSETISSQGQQGTWVSWVRVGDVNSNKIYHNVTGNGGGDVGTVSEQVKCVFSGSTSMQKCYTATNYTSPYYNLGCSSNSETCIADLRGTAGDRITWKSSCGGYAYTTMDGTNEYARFNCGTSVSPLINVISPSGGEAWLEGSTHQIQWQPVNSAVRVEIYLYRDGRYITGMNGAANGLYSWTIPVGIVSQGGGQSNYSLRIIAEDATGNITIAQGNSASFSIVATATQSAAISIATDPTVGVQSQSVIPGSGGYVFLAFTLTAGSSADATISSINLGCGGYACNSVTNTRLWAPEAGSLGPLGQTWYPSAGNSQLFLPNITIPRGTSKKFLFIGGVSTNAPAGQQIQFSLTNNLVTISGSSQGASVSGSSFGNVLTVSGPSQQSVDLKINNSDGPITVGSGSTINLTWSSSGVSACTAVFNPTGSGTYNIGTGTAGSMFVATPAATTLTAYIYQVACGTTSDTVQVNVSPTAAPPATFAAVPTAVASGNTVAFSWTDAAAAQGFTNFFGTTSCILTGITMYDVTNNRDFQCGDIDRQVPASGSDTIRFTSTNTTATSIPFVLQYGNGQSLTQTITVTAPAVSTSPSITVTSPNGGEQWAVGTTHRITWASQGITSGYYTVYLTGTDWPAPSLVVGNVPANVNYFDWTVPSGTYNNTITTGQYKYKIAVNTVGAWDESDATFSITPAIQTQAAGNLQVSIDAATPPSNWLTMGSVSNPLATFRLAETSGSEDVRITDLKLVQQVMQVGAKSSFNNTSLYNGSTLVGVSGAASALSGVGYIYSFHFANPITVPKAGAISLALKGDVYSYSSAGATDNSNHLFSIQGGTNGTVTATGVSSNAPVNVMYSNAFGKMMTVLRSKLTVTATPVGVTSGRAPQVVDDLASINFTADSAGPIQLNKVTLTFQGTGVGTVDFAANMNSIVLYDPATGMAYTKYSSTSNSITYDLQGYIVAAGSMKNFTLRADSTKILPPPQPNVSLAITVSITGQNDVQWTDGLDSAATANLGLLPSMVPLRVASVVYASGTGGTNTSLLQTQSSVAQTASVLQNIGSTLGQISAYLNSL
ncbi:MAG: hypothetical protein Q8P49_03035 [Candidatus Liptonbacteria bacterium]|nr:hypothetical protein [Candidatus Liptonbacteria bacterium]